MRLILANDTSRIRVDLPTEFSKEFVAKLVVMLHNRAHHERDPNIKAGILHAAHHIERFLGGLP